MSASTIASIVVLVMVIGLAAATTIWQARQTTKETLLKHFKLGMEAGVESVLRISQVYVCNHDHGEPTYSRVHADDDGGEP